MTQPLPLDEAVRALKRDPTQPVVARVDDLTVEMRAVTALGSTIPRTVGEALAGVEWHGDETLVRKPDPARWDLARIATAAGDKDLELAASGFDAWAAALEREDSR